jgi:hypothetical protein
MRRMHKPFIGTLDRVGTAFGVADLFEPAMTTEGES